MSRAVSEVMAMVATPKAARRAACAAQTLLSDDALARLVIVPVLQRSTTVHDGPRRSTSQTPTTESEDVVERLVAAQGGTRHPIDARSTLDHSDLSPVHAGPRWSTVHGSVDHHRNIAFP